MERGTLVVQLGLRLMVSGAVGPFDHLKSIRGINVPKWPYTAFLHKGKK